jgi:hypothetical protein
MKMKTVLLFILTLWQISLFGQLVDSLGIGDNKYFNRQESLLLSQELKDHKKTFDFTNKKLAFIGGTTGNRIWTKEDYFDIYVKPRIARKEKIYLNLIILTKKERKISGNYDALILIPVQIFSNKQKLKILKDLKNAR